MTLAEDMVVDPVPGVDFAAVRDGSRTHVAIQTCRLDEFSASGADNLHWLYDWLGRVGGSDIEDLTTPSEPARVRGLINENNLARIVECCADLGSGSPSPHMAHVLHDLRGTALQQVLGLSDLWLAGLAEPEALKAITILATDHAKLMRHLVRGLDELRRAEDTIERLHGVPNLKRRFPFLHLANEQGQVLLDFSASWEGDFAMTCGEFSTVLRQLYNLINNAARHTADQAVLVRVHGKPVRDATSVRFVVGNRVSSAERHLMSREVMRMLWRGYTTTGSGLGLIGGARLVAEAFGLEDSDRAVSDGYVGVA